MQNLPRIVTPLLIVLLCALVVWWALRLMPGDAIPVPPPAPVDGAAGSGRVEAVVASARLFGSRKPGALSDNVRALGVIADGSGRGSVIVSVDGQPAKVYRVGDTLDGRLVAAIRPEEIELDAGGARQVFRLPPARASAPGVTVVGTGEATVAAPPAMQPAVSMPPPPAMPGQDLQPGLPPVQMQQPPNIPDASTMNRRGRPVPGPDPVPGR